MSDLTDAELDYLQIRPLVESATLSAATIDIVYRAIAELRAAREQSATLERQCQEYRQVIFAGETTPAAELIELRARVELAELANRQRARETEQVEAQNAALVAERDEAVCIALDNAAARDFALEWGEELEVGMGTFRQQLRSALFPFWPNNMGVGGDEIVDAVRRAVEQNAALVTALADLKATYLTVAAAYADASEELAGHDHEAATTIGDHLSLSWDAAALRHAEEALARVRGAK